MLRLQKFVSRSGHMHPFYAAAAYVMFIAIILFLSPELNKHLGFWGMGISQGLLLIISVAACAASKADFKKVFMLSMPSLVQVFGFLLLWAGTFVLTTVFSAVLTAVYPEAVHTGSQLKDGMPASMLIPMIAIAAMIPAAAEEAAFRGTILSAMRGSIPPFAAMLLSSLLFSFAHIHPFRMAQTFALGLSLSYAAISTGSMLAPVLMHFLNNTLVVLFVFFPSMGIWLHRTITLNGRYDYYPVIVSGIMLCAGIILLKTDSSKKGDKQHGNQQKAFKDGPLL